MKKQWVAVWALLLVMLTTAAGANTIVDIQGNNGPVGTLSFDYVGAGAVTASVFFMALDPYVDGYCDENCTLTIGLLNPASVVDMPTISYADFSSASSPWSGSAITAFALGNIGEWEFASVTFSADAQVQFIRFTGHQSDPQDFDALLGDLNGRSPLIAFNTPTSTPEPGSVFLLGSGAVLFMRKVFGNKDQVNRRFSA